MFTEFSVRHQSRRILWEDAAAVQVKLHKRQRKQTMKKTICALTLALVLTLSAYGGEMQCGVTDTPPPPPTAQQSNIEPKSETATVMDTALIILTNLLPLL